MSTATTFDSFRALRGNRETHTASAQPPAILHRFGTAQSDWLFFFFFAVLRTSTLIFVLVLVRTRTALQWRGVPVRLSAHEYAVLILGINVP